MYDPINTATLDHEELSEVPEEYQLQLSDRYVYDMREDSTDFQTLDLLFKTKAPWIGPYGTPLDVTDRSIFLQTKEALEAHKQLSEKESLAALYKLTLAFAENPEDPALLIISFREAVASHILEVDLRPLSETLGVALERVAQGEVHPQVACLYMWYALKQYDPQCFSQTPPAVIKAAQIQQYDLE